MPLPTKASIHQHMLLFSSPKGRREGARRSAAACPLRCTEVASQPRAAPHLPHLVCPSWQLALLQPASSVSAAGGVCRALHTAAVLAWVGDGGSSGRQQQRWPRDWWPPLTTTPAADPRMLHLPPLFPPGVLLPFFWDSECYLGLLLVCGKRSIVGGAPAVYPGGWPQPDGPLTACWMPPLTLPFSALLVQWWDSLVPLASGPRREWQQAKCWWCGR